jgi:hypothetical protein
VNVPVGAQIPTDYPLDKEGPRLLEQFPGVAIAGDDEAVSQQAAVLSMENPS